MPQKELSASGFRDLFFGAYVGLNIGAYIITNAIYIYMHFFFGGGAPYYIYSNGAKTLV